MAETMNTLSTHPRDTVMHAVGHFHSLLVPVDLTAISDRVLERLALLPLAVWARVTLLHVIPNDASARALDRAERDARTALTSEACHLAGALPKHVSIDVVVKRGSITAAIAESAASTHADLIVMGRGEGRPLRDTFLGSTAERVVRRARVPVLVVRRAARGAYARPAVALDVAYRSTDVLELLLRLIPAPRPRVSMIHALDTPYRGAIYTNLTAGDAEEWRSELDLEAAQQMAALVRTALERAKVRPEDRPRWTPHVRLGSARYVIGKAVREEGADLLLLGTRGYTGLAHLLLGSVAGDVLRGVACDVLIVPNQQDKARYS